MLDFCLVINRIDRNKRSVVLRKLIPSVQRKKIRSHRNQLQPSRWRTMVGQWKLTRRTIPMPSRIMEWQPSPRQTLRIMWVRESSCGVNTVLFHIQPFLIRTALAQSTRTDGSSMDPEKGNHQDWSSVVIWSIHRCRSVTGETTRRCGGTDRLKGSFILL